MNADILERYIDRIYAFSVNHTFSRDEADELSQEILMTAIRAFPNLRDEAKFEPWLWGIANNTLRSFRRSAGKARKMYSYDVFYQKAAEESDRDEELYAYLRTKISRLSEIYRDIIILYYYDGLPVKEIAKKLNLPEGTVTWRLSAGREKLKKELKSMNESALHPIRMRIDIYGNGDYDGARKPFPTVYIDDALSQNILYYSYEKPRTVEELSNLCGVPAYYVEDKITSLMKYDAMIETGRGKYQTDFIIWSDKYGIFCEENAERCLMPIMDDLICALKSISREAMTLDFYKAEKSEADLFYLFGVLAFSYASIHHCPLPYPPFKKSFDGNEWRFIGNMETGKHNRIGIGIQHCGNLGSRGRFSHTSFNAIGGTVYRPMMPDHYINVCEDIVYHGETQDISALANAISDGYIIKRDDKSFFSTVPSFTLDQINKFNQIVETHLFPLINDYSRAVIEFTSKYKKLFPKHLYDDADRMCHNLFTGMFSVIADYAQRTGHILPPSDHCVCDVMIQFK